MNEEQNNVLSGISFLLKAFTVKQLSELYGVSAKTFRRWVKPIAEQLGRKQGYFYNISQVKYIIMHLGIPGDVIVE